MSAQHLVVFGNFDNDFISEVRTRLADHGVPSVNARTLEAVEFSMELEDDTWSVEFKLREFPQIKVGGVWYVSDPVITGGLNERDRRFAFEESHAALAAALGCNEKVVINQPLPPLLASRVNDPFVFRNTMWARGSEMCPHGLTLDRDYGKHGITDVEWCEKLNEDTLFLMKRVGRATLWFGANSGTLFEEISEKYVPKAVLDCAKQTARQFSNWYFELAVALQGERVYPRCASTSLCASSTRPFTASVCHTLAEELRASFGGR